MWIFNGTNSLLIPDKDENYCIKMSGSGKTEKDDITVEEVVSGNSRVLPISVQLAVNAQCACTGETT